MAVRDAIKRVRKYESKLDPEIIGKEYARLRKSMVEEISAYFAKISEIEIKTKAVLSECDLPVSVIPSYLCYTRELYRLSEKYAGFPLFREIRIAEAKWRGRILSPEILKMIRISVFGITLPEEI